MESLWPLMRKKVKTYQRTNTKTTNKSKNQINMSMTVLMNKNMLKSVKMKEEPPIWKWIKEIQRKMLKEEEFPGLQLCQETLKVKIHMISTEKLKERNKCTEKLEIWKKKMINKKKMNAIQILNKLKENFTFGSKSQEQSGGLERSSKNS